MEQGSVLKIVFWKHCGKLYHNIINNELPLGKALKLGSDSSNMSKTVWNKLNKNVKFKGCPGLLPFIPCIMNVVHNTFKEGLKVYNQESED